MSENAAALPTGDELRDEIIRDLGVLKRRVFTKDGLCLEDAGNAPNLTMTCELLEAFLVPGCFGGLDQEVRDILPYDDARQLLMAADSTRKDNVKNVKCNGGFLAGSYLVPPTGREDYVDVEVVDAASFALTAALHVRRLYRSEVTNDPEADAVSLALINGALEFLDRTRSYADQDTESDPDGWCWGDDGPRYSYRYFTYVALDGLLDFLDAAGEKDAAWLVGAEALARAKEIDAHISALTKTVIGQLDDSSLSDGMLSLDDDVTGTETKSWYFNLWTLYSIVMLWSRAGQLGLADTRQEDQLVRAVDRLTAEFVGNPSKTYFQKDFQFGLAVVIPGKTARDMGSWMDRSMCPVLLKMLCVYVPDLPGRSQDWDQRIRIVWDTLMDRRSKEPDGVWDAAKQGYSIYYTERAVEALVRMSSKYVPAEIRPTDGTGASLAASGGTDRAQLTVEISSAELARLMTHATAQTDPVTVLCDAIETELAPVAKDEAKCALEEARKLRASGKDVWALGVLMRILGSVSPPKSSKR